MLLPLRRHASLLLAAACVIAYVGGTYRFAVLDHRTSREEVQIGAMPAWLLLPAPPGDRAPAAVAAAPLPPVVIVQHGFSASRQAMSWIVRGLARNGFAVLASDFHGHGQNSVPFGLRDDLSDDLDSLVRYARSRPDVDGRHIALVGHSMGAFAVYRYALHHPDIDAVVPISGTAGGGDMQLPHNVLLVDATGDPAAIRHASRVTMRYLTGRAGVTLSSTEGDFGERAARRFVEVPGHDHVTILFSEVPVRETVGWLRRTWAMPAAAFEPAPPGMLGAGCIAVGAGLLLFFPIAGWLATALRCARPVGNPARGAAWMALASAVGAGVVLLAGVPVSFVPLIAGSELVSFLFLAGVFIAAAVWLRRRPWRDGGTPNAVVRSVLLGSAAFAVIYATCGTSVSRLFFNLLLTRQRAAWFVVIALLCLPLGIGLETGLRGTGGWRVVARTLAAKLFLLMGLTTAIAVGAMPSVIGLMLPSLAVVFLVTDAVAARLYVVSGSAVASGVLTALMLAWLPAAIFPLGS